MPQPALPLTLSPLGQVPLPALPLTQSPIGQAPQPTLPLTLRPSGQGAPTFFASNTESHRPGTPTCSPSQHESFGARCPNLLSHQVPQTSPRPRDPNYSFGGLEESLTRRVDWVPERESRWGTRPHGTPERKSRLGHPPWSSVRGRVGGAPKNLGRKIGVFGETLEFGGCLRSILECLRRGLEIIWGVYGEVWRSRDRLRDMYRLYWF